MIIGEVQLSRTQKIVVRVVKYRSDWIIDMSMYRRNTRTSEWRADEGSIYVERGSEIELLKLFEKAIIQLKKESRQESLGY